MFIRAHPYKAYNGSACALFQALWYDNGVNPT